MEEKIALFMRNLDITREEAIQLINDDKEVDHMSPRELENDLDEIQKEVIKKMKNSNEKTVKSAPAKREKKPDAAKDEVYNYIYSALESMDSNLEGSDNHREITFFNDGKKFKITISCPRS